MYRWITNTYETIELFVFYKKYILIIGSGLIVMSSWVRDVCYINQIGATIGTNQIATCKGESCEWRLHCNLRKAIFVFLRTKTLLHNSCMPDVCKHYQNALWVILCQIFSVAVHSHSKKNSDQGGERHYDSKKAWGQLQLESIKLTKKIINTSTKSHLFFNLL